MKQHTNFGENQNLSAIRPALSVVVPAYNEEANLAPFLKRLTKTLTSIGLQYEIIFVDDGSSDKTAERVMTAHSAIPQVKLVRLSRNFGKEAALNAGISHARGDAVVQIDADLQHPPELISDFVRHWQNGTEIVYGARQSRDGEPVVRKLLATCFYKVFASLSDVKLMEGLGDFLLMDRKVVNALLALPERERFTKGLYAWVGFSRMALPFEVEKRQEGNSGWSMLKLFSFGVNAIVSFGTIPLKVWTYLGLTLAIPSLAYGIYTIIKTLVFGIDVPGYASLMVALCFFSGVQLCGLGIIGEYLGRVLAEVKQRPIYLVKETEGFDLDVPKTANTASQNLQQAAE
ncbi:MAG: glycosyltransferase family 2 protein [Pseudomonadota bacterium]